MALLSLHMLLNTTSSGNPHTSQKVLQTSGTYDLLMFEASLSSVPTCYCNSVNSLCLGHTASLCSGVVGESLEQAEGQFFMRDGCHPPPPPPRDRAALLACVRFGTLGLMFYVADGFHYRRMALVNLLLAPFLFVFLLIYFCLKNTERFYHSPGSVGARRWSPLASWQLREFNELPYYVQHRSVIALPSILFTPPPLLPLLHSSSIWRLSVQIPVMLNLCKPGDKEIGRQSKAYY